MLPYSLNAICNMQFENIANFAKEMLSGLDNLNRAIEVSDKINLEDKNIDINTFI